MTSELGYLFQKPMVPCPYCGTKNEEDSETCLCCGKKLTAAVPEPPAVTTADAAETPPAEAAAQTAAVTAAASTDVDSDAPDKAPRKRLPWWMIVLIVLVNAAMVCAVVLQGMYLSSPAHTIADYIADQKYIKATTYYTKTYIAGGAEKDLFYQTALTRRLTAQFDTMRARYKSGEWTLSFYATRACDLLDAALVTGLGADYEQYVKNDFQNLMEETYAAYVRSITTSGELDYNDALDIFYEITSRNLFADANRTNELLEDMALIFQEETLFSTAQNFEANGLPQHAISCYADIGPDHPRSQAAVEGIDRCIADWADQVRRYMNGPEVDPSTLHDHISQMDHVLKILEEHQALTDARKGTLTTLRAEAAPRFAALVKASALKMAHEAKPEFYPAFQELQYALELNPGDAELTAALKKIALGAHRDNTLPDLTVATMLHHALQYFPEDAELLSAATSRKARLKADFRKKLPDYLNSYDPALFTAEALSALMDIMPEDTDLQALDRAIEHEFYHHLFNRGIYGSTKGFASLFPEKGDHITVTDHLLINPAADASGVLHQSAGLYRMTAAAGAPAVCSQWSPADRTVRYGRLSFSVFADAACTGTGVLEVRTTSELDIAGLPVWSEPVWRSTVDRTTNGLQVELDLNRALGVRITLTSTDGSVVVLLDNAALWYAE